MMQSEQLDKFFNPKIIAVIGASDRQHSVGGAIFANIKNSAFAGKVVPVNNRAGTVLGDKTFASVADIVEKIDLAIIATPAAAVLGVLDECARAGIPGAGIV
jgi:acetyltransferase